MKKMLFISILLIFTVGCAISNPLIAPTPTPYSEEDYLISMKHLSKAVVEILFRATEMVHTMALDDPDLITGLKHEAAVMEEACNSAKRIIPPSQYKEAHSLFIESVELYRDGLYTAATAVETRDEDKMKATGELMEAADEKMIQATEKLKEILELRRQHQKVQNIKLAD